MDITAYAVDIFLKKNIPECHEKLKYFSYLFTNWIEFQKLQYLYIGLN